MWDSDKLEWTSNGYPGSIKGRWISGTIRFARRTLLHGDSELTPSVTSKEETLPSCSGHTLSVPWSACRLSWLRRLWFSFVCQREYRTDHTKQDRRWPISRSHRVDWKTSIRLYLVVSKSYSLLGSPRLFVSTELTTWCWVLLEKLLVVQLLKNFQMEAEVSLPCS
jgi:hypothetical protein